MTVSSLAPSPFPRTWKLNPREAAMLACFAPDETVPHAALEAAIAPYRVGAIGRPLKVHLHYLRGKLVSHGIRIVSVHGAGFCLSPESRVALAPYFAALGAASAQAA
jgi:DNA-binding response OmpR family regulator